MRKSLHCPQHCAAHVLGRSSGRRVRRRWARDSNRRRAARLLPWLSGARSCLRCARPEFAGSFCKSRNARIVRPPHKVLRFDRARREGPSPAGSGPRCKLPHPLCRCCRHPVPARNRFREHFCGSSFRTNPSADRSEDRQCRAREGGRCVLPPWRVLSCHSERSEEPRAGR